MTYTNRPRFERGAFRVGWLGLKFHRCPLLSRGGRFGTPEAERIGRAHVVAGAVVIVG
jgi:hypothetical protein